MKIKIYDSVKRKKILLNLDLITIYNCGPTVYYHIHIGNLRPVIVFDILIRLCQLNHQKYKYVHNLTDIDDKIIAAASQNQTTETSISQQYIQEYLKLWKTFQFIKPHKMPTVSNNISGIIKYIEKLVQKKFAYLNLNDVFFSVHKYSDYGKISKQKSNFLNSNNRQIKQVEKQNIQDFVLWKATTTGLNWPSIWSNGRPGWHTECAYFIKKYIGKQVSIHGGGLDLKFPHHENENAQNYALHQCDLAKVWMHIAPVNVNQQKMSKSLNNYVLVKDLLISYTPSVIKWFFLQTHYRNPVNFSFDLLNQAQKEWNSLIRTIYLAKTHLYLHKKTWKVSKPIKINSKVNQELKNDLNFANFIQILYQWKNLININLKLKKFSLVQNYLQKLEFHLHAFGFVYPELHHAKNLKLISQWQNKLKTKDYQAADLLRQKLIMQKIW